MFYIIYFSFKPSPASSNTNVTKLATAVALKPPVIACPSRPAILSRQISMPNIATTNTVQRAAPSSLVNPIKVINLSQIQQKNLQEKLNTNKLNHKIIQITNTAQTPTLHASPEPPTGNQHPTSTVKITKVVSSRPATFNANLSPQNVVYLNKTALKTDVKTATASSSPVFLAANKTQGFINQQPPKMRLLGNVSSTTHHQFITKTTNSPANKIPSFYTTSPKIISTQYLNNTNTNSTTNPLASTTSNHHINILNSNINRYLNQSKQLNNNNNSGITSTQLPSITNTNNTSSPVTFSPKYLMNMNNSGIINNPNNNNCNNVSSLNNPSSNPIVNGGGGAAGTPGSLSNYFLQEQDEDVVVDEEEELGHAETYANYMPSKCKN